MKRLSLVPVLLLATYCSSSSGPASQSTAQPGHGAITIQVVPNPIVAQSAGGNAYVFPFDVVVRETGGRAVNVTRVTADVTALGGIPVDSESYDAARINSLGYGTSLPANGELRYHFSPKKSVPDERLFGGVSADLKVDAVDDSGTPASARTTVTVTR